MSLAIRITLSAVVVSAGSAHAALLGSDLIDRDLSDVSAGLSLIYRGATQPVAGDGGFADQFSVYSQGSGGSAGQYWITPFLLEVTGTDQYTIVAIGSSRDLTGEVGVRSYGFGTIAGDATLEAGKSYTFGYRNAQHEAGVGGVSTVAGTQNSGAVPFTGYDDFSDQWSYAFSPELSIGTVFGTGGVALDMSGFSGRIYSAQLSTIPAPAGCALLASAGFIAARRRR